jgi:hypothetical protein
MPTLSNLAHPTPGGISTQKKSWFDSISMHIAFGAKQMELGFIQAPSFSKSRFRERQSPKARAVAAMYSLLYIRAAIKRQSKEELKALLATPRFGNLTFAIEEISDIAKKNHAKNTSTHPALSISRNIH